MSGPTEKNYPARCGAYASLIEGLLDILEIAQGREALTGNEEKLHFFIRERFNAIEAGQLEMALIMAPGESDASK